jgi:hypothetical protein
MVNRLLLFSVVILFTVATLGHALAVWKGPPQMLTALDDETRGWVQDLKNKFKSPCCAAADGFPAEWDMDGVVDDTSKMSIWDAYTARSGYCVRLSDGKWHDVLNFALLEQKPNKLGYAVVWLIPGAVFQIQCFLPGAGW